MISREICHVCKKEKKPYTVFMKDDVFSFVMYYQAREEGPICDRCDKYFAMTGDFKDATDKEFEIARKASWFSRMVLKLWEKDGKLNEEKNLRDWDGTVSISKWCRKELTKNEFKRN